MTTHPIRKAKQANAARRRALLLGCTALIALTPAELLAQEGAAVVLEEVVVQSGGAGGGTGDDDANTIVATKASSGGKIARPLLETPASVSVITAKEIEKRNAQTVEEIIAYTPGVVTDFYGADERFDYYKIRGFDAFQYRDGLTLGRAFGSLREDSYAYERVEVLKGGASTTFGVSDPGGAVNFITKTPKRGRWGEAYVTGGSFDRKEVGFDFGDDIIEDGTLSYRLTGKLKDADNEYDFSRDDAQFIMGGLTWRPTDQTNLTLVFDHLNKDGVPGSGGYPNGIDFERSTFFGEPDFNYRGAERNTLTAKFDHDFGNGLSFAADGRYSDTHTDFGYAYIASTPTDGSTVANRSFFTSDVQARQLIGDARLQYDTSFGDIDSQTLVGIMHNDQVSDSKTGFGAAPGIDWTNPVYSGAPTAVPLFAASKQDLNTTGLYAQQDLTFFDKLIASVSLRNDWIDIDQTNQLTGALSRAEESEFTKRFGLTYKITPEVAAYASYAESAVPASALTNEVERGEQYELGVKYEPLAFPALFSAAVYDLRKTNVTVTDPITLLPSPIGEVRVRGLDLEAKAELPMNFSMTAAYTYLDAEIIENGTGGNEGNQPQQTPAHVASLWLDWTLPGEGWRGDLTIGGGARYVGTYFFDAANTIGTGDHVVVDAALNYEIVENTSLQINATNLFDEKHVAYGGFGADFYNPGRTVSATLRHTW
ncbi:TonB-dependent siderophore receptor [Tianweitania sediminis]|uniref:TonB-dependent siderophore receptor n=1 Tax=Tianweitania sediminis TaxID=1502156 RepID=A0A8J7QZ56_9HYPH|nr:TonB-dependent siderophore receptor [Tianweitania sediminis]MBP0438680.1 TonB-dependent siderophore receptor [Tianweitania sediminis]